MSPGLNVPASGLLVFYILLYSGLEARYLTPATLSGAEAGRCSC